MGITKKKMAVNGADQDEDGDGDDDVNQYY